MISRLWARDYEQLHRARDSEQVHKPIDIWLNISYYKLSYERHFLKVIYIYLYYVKIC